MTLRFGFFEKALAIMSGMLAVVAVGEEPKTLNATDARHFVVALPRDVSVELVAVTSGRGEDRKVWRADGSRFQQQPEYWNGDPGGDRTEPDKLVREYVLKFTGLTANQRVTYRLPGNWTATHPDKNGVARLQVPISEPDRPVDLRLGITDDAWGPYQNVNSDGTPIPPFDVPAACRDVYREITVEDVESRAQTTYFKWAGLRGLDDRAEHEVIAIDLDGEKHEPFGRTIWTKGPEHFAAEVFQLPLKQIAIFQYRLRPYRFWVTFENVSHKPEHATEVQIKVEEVRFKKDGDQPPNADQQLSQPDASRSGRGGFFESTVQRQLAPPRWIEWASPGTNLIRQRATNDITGLVVGPSDRPVVNAEVFRFGREIYRTDEWGRFRVPAERGSQSLMYVVDSNHRLWFGAPTSGDVLRIALEKKPAQPDPTGPRSMRVRLIDATDASPIANLTVKAVPQGALRNQGEVEATTDETGVAVFEGLQWIAYRWNVSSETERPYVASSRFMDEKRVDELLIPLRRACELVLRAVDDETGRGVPGVKFGRERAGAELWLSVVVPDAIGSNRPVRYDFKPAAGKPPESDYETDAQGYYRCLVGPETWSYAVYSFPDGYDSIVPINGRHEVDIETPGGARVEYTFRLVRD